MAEDGTPVILEILFPTGPELAVISDAVFIHFFSKKRWYLFIRELILFSPMRLMHGNTSYKFVDVINEHDEGFYYEI